MEMKLLIKGKEKTFVAARPKARMVRSAINLMSTVNLEKVKDTDIDTLVDFAVDAYGNQFTRDDVYDGLYADELFPAILKVVTDISGGTTERIETKNE